jgi:tRNA (guanine26-N2/guanine27-N2)-dimethyltransferase
MAGPGGPLIEGKVKLSLIPSGGVKGPGSKGGVFFNPAMVQNRDFSILIIQYLLEMGLLPGKSKKVLDGLCGSGARALRLAAETDLLSKSVGITGTDINPSSIEMAQANAELNRVDIDLRNEDLNKHLINMRYSYVDIDPFGSPVPFIQSAVLGVLNGGLIGVTATDTAALTGSIPRVANRRYGINSFMTHAYQEVACRSLMGYVARIAASFERSVDPLFFYVSDHFVRGYIRIEKGAKKSDISLEKVGWIDYSRPGPPSLEQNGIGINMMGPIWTGPLEDQSFCKGLMTVLDQDRWEYMSSRKPMKILLERAISEYGFPILGYDINVLSSHLKMSPPSLETITDGLISRGKRFSRSRFSPTIFKTDAEWEEVVSLFRSGGI